MYQLFSFIAIYGNGKFSRWITEIIYKIISWNSYQLNFRNPINLRKLPSFPKIYFPVYYNVTWYAKWWKKLRNFYQSMNKLSIYFLSEFFRITYSNHLCLTNILSHEIKRTFLSAELSWVEGNFSTQFTGIHRKQFSVEEDSGRLMATCPFKPQREFQSCRTESSRFLGRDAVGITTDTVILIDRKREDGRERGASQVVCP